MFVSLASEAWSCSLREPVASEARSPGTGPNGLAEGVGYAGNGYLLSTHAMPFLEPKRYSASPTG